MRSLLLIGALFSLMQTAYAQRAYSALSYRELKGKVRSVKAGSDFEVFDEYGRLVYERHYHHINKHWYYPPDTVELYENFYTYGANDSIIAQEGAKVFGKVLFEYNSKNQLVHAIKYDRDGTLYSDIFYDYDGRGNLVKVSSLRKGERHVASSMKYDTHNNMTERFEYWDHGEKLSKYNWVYNNRNQIVEKRQYDFGKKERTQTNYKYGHDSRHLITEDKYRNFSTGEHKQINYTYDSKGRIVEKQYGSGQSMIYRYDDNGNDTTIIEYGASGDLENKTKIEHTYNSEHQLVKRSEQHSGKSNYEVRDTYSDFDKQGNWLQHEYLIIDSRGTQRSFVKREISYYYQ